MAVFGRSEDFEFEKIGTPSVTTDASYYDASISRCALELNGVIGNGWIAHDLGDLEDFSCSLRLANGGNTAQNNMIPLTLFDDSNVQRVRIRVESGLFVLQYYNGSAWISVGQLFAPSNSAWTRTLCVRIDQANGKISTYLDNFPAQQANIDMSSWGGIRKALISGWGNTTNQAFSEFMWGDELLLFHRYVTRWPTGNGDLTDGTGSYTGVDEAALSDLDAIFLPSNGDSKTFTRGSVTLPDGDVKTVKVAARVAVSPEGGAQNVKARLRKSSVNYDQASNFPGVSEGKALYEAYWDKDPSTSANWVREDAASTALQFGLVAQP